jgi:hypothetical protein
MHSIQYQEESLAVEEMETVADVHRIIAALI